MGNTYNGMYCSVHCKEALLYSREVGAHNGLFIPYIIISGGGGGGGGPVSKVLLYMKHAQCYVYIYFVQNTGHNNVML